MGNGQAAVLGMVGGGQLARMTAQAAVSLGLSLRVLADRPDDSASLVVRDVEIGAADDLAALSRFAKGCDVVTFDHEHVPQDRLQAMEADGIVVRPASRALLYAQDKLAQRQRLAEMGIPCRSSLQCRHRRTSRRSVSSTAGRLC